MHSVAVYLVQLLYGGPEKGGWYYEASELCAVPELTAFGTTFPVGHEDRAVRQAAEVQAHLDRDWNVDDHARPPQQRPERWPLHGPGPRWLASPRLSDRTPALRVTAWRFRLPSPPRSPIR